MYRDEHEAAIQRAEALDRELRILRNRAESNAETRERLGVIDEELKEARTRLCEDARRLAGLEVQVRALRHQATDPPTRPMALPAPGRRWRVAAGVGLALALSGLSTAVAWLALEEPSVRVKVITIEKEPPPPPRIVPDVVGKPAAPRAISTGQVEPDLEVAKGYYTQGLRLFATSHMVEAIAAFKKAVKLAPAFGDPHRALGSLYVTNGNVKGMCKEFKTYVKLSPHAGDAAKIKAEMAKYAATVPECRLDRLSPAVVFSPGATRSDGRGLQLPR